MNVYIFRLKPYSSTIVIQASNIYTALKKVEDDWFGEGCLERGFEVAVADGFMSYAEEKNK